MTYSPFGDVATHDLCSTHLAALARVPEGWFVEYKREPCKARDYAKEASAFANSRGGWVFIGLAEEPTTRIPAGGPGLPTIEAARLLDAARDAIVQNLSPSPHIELKIVSGPIAELSVPEDRSILVIYVPESQNTPHVHSSGRIFRRQAEVTDPVQVTDRAELDELYARKARSREITDEQLNFGFDERWAQSIPVPWIHVALVPDPAHQGEIKTLRFDRFRELIRGPSQPVSLPDVYPSGLGFVARNHSSQQVPHGAAIALECAHGGAFYVTIPLSAGPFRESDLPLFLRSVSGRRFGEVLRARSFNEAQVIDATYLSHCMLGVGEHMHRVLDEIDGPGSYLCRVRMRNFLRCVPFFDSSTYVDWCASNTVPVIHHGDLQIPWLTKHWLAVEECRSENPLTAPLVRIALALGLGASEDALTRILGESVHASSSRSSRTNDAY